MFARHSLIWLTNRGWQEALASVAPDDWNTVNQWRRQDWPVIARRTEPGNIGHQVYAGIAPPPVCNERIKRRIPLCVARTGVKKIAYPLRLDAIIPSVPTLWRTSLAALDAEAKNQGMSFLVYGSMALQTLTGQSYLTEQSDIDLLFYPVTGAQLAQGLALLRRHATSLPLDGEIIFPSGQAVAWKEWSNATVLAHHTQVLVKHIHGIQLCSVQALLMTLEAEPCMH